MTRDMSAAAITESLKSFGAMPVWFVVLYLDSGTERFWSGRGDFSWGGDIFEGTGDLGAIGDIEESTAQQAFDLPMSLSGVTQDRIDRAMDQDVIGRVAEIYRGWLDADEQLVDVPDLWWRGRLNTMHIELGEIAVISVTAVERLVDWDRARVQRFADNDQQRRFPGDKGFEFTAETAAKTIVWGGLLVGGQGGGPVSHKRSNIDIKHRGGRGGGAGP